MRIAEFWRIPARQKLSKTSPNTLVTAFLPSTNFQQSVLFVLFWDSIFPVSSRVR
jgi:hypothetical protein